MARAIRSTCDLLSAWACERRMPLRDGGGRRRECCSRGRGEQSGATVRRGRSREVLRTPAVSQEQRDGEQPGHWLAARATRPTSTSKSSLMWSSSSSACSRPRDNVRSAPSATHEGHRGGRVVASRRPERARASRSSRGLVLRRRGSVAHGRHLRQSARLWERRRPPARRTSRGG